MKTTITVKTSAEAFKAIEGLGAIYDIETESTINNTIIDDLNDKLNVALQDIEDRNNTIDDLHSKIDSILYDLTTLKSEAAIDNAVIKTLKTTNNEQKEVIASKNTIIDDLNDKLDNALYNLTTSESELATKNTVIKALKATNSELESKKNKKEMEIDYKEEAKKYKKWYYNVKEDLNNTRKNRNNLLERYEALKDTIKKLTVPYDLNDIEIKADKKDSDIEEWAKYFNPIPLRKEESPSLEKGAGLPNDIIVPKVGTPLSDIKTLDDVIAENRGRSKDVPFQDESVLLDENGDVIEVMGKPIEDFIEAHTPIDEDIDEDALGSVLGLNEAPATKLSNSASSVLLPADTIFIRGKGKGIDGNKVKDVIVNFDTDIQGDIPNVSEYRKVYSRVAKVLNRKTLGVIRERGHATTKNVVPEVHRYSYLCYLEAIEKSLIVKDDKPQSETIFNNEIKTNIADELISDIANIKASIANRTKEAIEAIENAEVKISPISRYALKAEELKEEHKGAGEFDYARLKIDIMDLYADRRISKNELREVLRVFVDENKRDRTSITGLFAGVSERHYKALGTIIAIIEKDAKGA